MSIRKDIENIERIDGVNLHVNEEILEVLKDIRHELNPQRTVKTAVIFGDDTMATNALVLIVGQSSTATIEAFLTDGVTLSGGVVSKQVFTISDPSLTLVVNPDGTATITGVAASTGAVNGTAASTVTDTDGAISNWVQPFTVTVNAVKPPPPKQITQVTGVSFSTPTPVIAGASLVSSTKTEVLPVPVQ